MKILYLTIQKQWFDEIKAGTKTIEYREDKPFWRKRLMNEDGTFKKFDAVHFRNGYNPDSPVMLLELNEIRLNNWEFEIELGKQLDI